MNYDPATNFWSWLIISPDAYVYMYVFTTILQLRISSISFHSIKVSERCQQTQIVTKTNHKTVSIEMNSNLCAKSKVRQMKDLSVRITQFIFIINSFFPVYESLLRTLHWRTSSDHKTFFTVKTIIYCPSYRSWLSQNFWKRTSGDRWCIYLDFKTHWTANKSVQISLFIW